MTGKKNTKNTFPNLVKPKGDDPLRSKDKFLYLKFSLYFTKSNLSYYISFT